MAEIFNDILMDESFVPIVRDGDLVVGPSIDQEVDTIMYSSPGQLPINPLCGPALRRFKNAAIQAEELEGLVKLHLAIDGKRSRVSVEDNQTIIDAEQE
jgi:hypothetical protein